jgi:hypothetical protein
MTNISFGQVVNIKYFEAALIDRKYIHKEIKQISSWE